MSLLGFITHFVGGTKLHVLICRQLNGRILFVRLRNEYSSPAR